LKNTTDVSAHRFSYCKTGVIAHFFLTLVIATTFWTSNATGNSGVDSDKPQTTAPGFSLPSLNNETTMSLSDFSGKIVYLDFWASWCGPCRASFPALQQLQNEFSADNFAIIGINLDDQPAKALRFLARNPVNFTLLYDAKSVTPKQYNIQAMPSSFIIDSNGFIRYSHAGFKKDDIKMIRANIIKLLGEIH